MKQNNFPRLRSLCAALASVSFLAVACNNNDTTTAPSTSDTAAMAMADTAMKHEPAVNANPTPDTVASTSKGMAKPNPAKKGMKGTVVITEPPKMSGAMEADNTGVYSNVEVYPSFPGGSKGLQKYFDKNLQYPTGATEEGIEGMVNVMFTVDETGKLSDPHIMGDKLGYGLEDEALRVVKAMPHWQPGQLKGKNVKTRFTLPVSFQLH